MRLRMTTGRASARRDTSRAALDVSRRTLLTAAATAVVLAPLPYLAVREGGRGKQGPGPVPVADTAGTVLRPAPATVDLGSRTVSTWAYGSGVPGPQIRVSAGGTVDATLDNGLPRETTVHWHGIRITNPMDGAPGLTQTPVAPGATFRYTFTAPDPGTYFYHSHVGTQLDRGLHGPLVVENPAEPLAYDHEWVLLIDDWLDGTGTDPDAVLANLHDHPGSAPSMNSTLLGGRAGMVSHPLHLLNGRTPQAAPVLQGAPGDRVRLRIINAGADTAYRVALGGHRLQVTHTDGFPVVPVTVDSLLIGMGERYDALVTLGDGVFPLAAAAEGKGGGAFGVVRTAAGTAPGPTWSLPEFGRTLLDLGALRADASVDLGSGAAREVRLTLGEGPLGMSWSIGSPSGGGLPSASPPRVRVDAGERVRLTFTNATSMWHPVHLHGHTFQVRAPGAGGPRKDTVNLVPGQTLSVDLVADNPGEWMLHCHNLYHQELGMMASLGYGAAPAKAAVHGSGHSMGGHTMGGGGPGD